MPSLDISFLKHLKTDFKRFPLFIESGTQIGITTFAVEPFFEKVYTIEISEKYHNIAKSKYNGNKIEFILGQSHTVFETLLETIDKPAIFFLDGHWSAGDSGKGDKDTPLVEEMDIIQKKFKHECIIIVDDVRLFGKGPKKRNEICDWEDISVLSVSDPIKDRILDRYFLPSELHPMDRMIFHIRPRHTYRCTLSGGLGNRMFAFASVYGLSKKDNNNFDVVVGQEVCKEHQNDYTWLNNKLSAFMCDTDDDRTFYTYTQPYNEWIDIKVNTNSFIDKDTILTGALQCEMNFKNVEDDIRNIFKIDEKTSNEISEFEQNNSIDLNNCTVIHVRLGDYLHTPLLGLNLENYYKKCLSLIDSKHVYVMCEDLENLHKVYPSLSEYPTTGTHDYVFDMYFLSKCKNVICSNSTFAWWGAWLNEVPDKKVFIPHKWFSDGRQQTLYMQGATVV